MSFEEVVDEYTDITAGKTLLPVDEFPSYIAESLPDTNYDQPETARRCFDTVWRKLQTLAGIDKLGSSREYRILAVEDIWVAALYLNNKRRYDKVIQRTLARLGCPAHEKSGCRIYRGKLFDQKGVPTPDAGQQFMNQLPEIWTTDTPASFRCLFSDFVRQCLDKASKTKQQRLQELQALQASMAQSPTFEGRESQSRSRTIASEPEGTTNRKSNTPTAKRRASRHSIIPPNPRKRPKRVSSSGSEVALRQETSDNTMRPSEVVESEFQEGFPEFTYKDDAIDGDYQDTPSPNKVTFHLEEQLRSDQQRKLPLREDILAPQTPKSPQTTIKKRARKVSDLDKTKIPNYPQQDRKRRQGIWCEECWEAHKCCTKHKKCRGCRKVGCSMPPLSPAFIAMAQSEGALPTPEQTSPQWDMSPMNLNAAGPAVTRGKMETPIQEQQKISLQEEFAVFSSTKYDVVLRSLRAACSDIMHSRASIDFAIRKRAAAERQYADETKGTRRELEKIENMRRHHEELQAKNEELRKLYPDLATFSGVTWNEEGYQRKLKEQQEKLRVARDKASVLIEEAERDENEFRAKEDNDVDTFKRLQALVAKVGNEVGYEEFIQSWGALQSPT